MQANQREHRHREHRHRSRPTDGAASPQPGSNANPIILTPATAQLKDRDRERERERARRQQSSQARELSMRVQPLAPTSRNTSHLNTRERETNGGTTHPYASASATPTTPTPGASPGTFPRTTSNSPLPPIPSDDRGLVGQSGSNVALGTTAAAPIQTYAHPGASGSGPTMSRGMSVARMDGLGYGGKGVGAAIEEEPPRRRGLLALLCCRS